MLYFLREFRISEICVTGKGCQRLIPTQNSNQGMLT